MVEEGLHVQGILDVVAHDSAAFDSVCMATALHRSYQLSLQTE